MISIGIIGTGAMGRNHARVGAELEVLKGICDLNMEAARREGTNYGVPACSDYKDFLSSGA